MSALFEGKLRQLPYALAALAVLLVQYAAVYWVFQWAERSLPIDLVFIFVPLRKVVELDRGYGHYGAIELLLFILMLIVAWVQAVLAFRRAADAGLRIPGLTPPEGRADNFSLDINFVTAA